MTTTSDICERLISAAKYKLFVRIALAIPSHKFVFFAQNDLVLDSRAVIKQVLQKNASGLRD